MMGYEYYCEFTSRNGVIRVEFETELPNANTQIRQIQLDPEGKTKQQLVWSPPSKRPQSPSTQESIVAEFALPLQMPFQEYLKDVRLVFNESQRLKELLNRQSARIAIEQFSRLNGFQTVKEQLENFDDDISQVLFAEYSKILQLLRLNKNLKELFDKYSTAVKNINFKTHNFQQLFTRFPTDIQQINESKILQSLFNSYFTAIQVFERSNYTRNLLYYYFEIYEGINDAIHSLDYQKLERDTLILLSLLKDSYSLIYQHTVWFQNIAQDLLEFCSEEFCITNDI
jgi:hypothetical protein